MATFRGLVNTLHIRDDGWVEVIIQAVHTGNSTEIFYIKDLDGDITMAHKRLGQLSLLRDAITRILPVELDYEVDPSQGNLISEVTVHPRPSIDGREAHNTVTGVVIGLSIKELGPVSGSHPYKDAADLAGITLLQNDGTVLNLLLDLQREEALTMHSMLDLLQTAHQTRRPVALLVSIGTFTKKDNQDYNFFMNSDKASGSVDAMSGYIEACQWITVPEETLDYHYGFIERIGERYESFDAVDAPAASHLKVVYTTAPGQTPEGDISDNGSFQPTTQTVWLPSDSPLFKLLKTSLKSQLQVKLGLLNDQIHEVELVGHIGSAARPIWICIKQSAIKTNSDERCDNTPTIQTPAHTTLNQMKIDLCWKAQGYFNEGIWRFQVHSPSTYELNVDGRFPCCGQTSEQCCCVEAQHNALNHFYLKGVHHVELLLHDQSALQPFSFDVYRIR
jgi:hypothetical protein